MSFQKTIKAISDPTRREILNLLKDSKMKAGDISSRFNSTNATISHHLSILKEAGLIFDKKEGKNIYYEINMSVLEDILNWIISLKN